MNKAHFICHLRAGDIVRFHAAALAQHYQAGPPPTLPQSVLWDTIAGNFKHNAALWDEEDQARRRDVPDSAIANSKRLIDRYNQQRNDAIECIDEIILSALPPPTADAKLHSETAGSLIDRLAILSLKIHHMDWQTHRQDSDAEHLETCRNRLVRLTEQRDDLAGCLDALLDGCQCGNLYFKVYRQFKMYNDPRYNPWLSGTELPLRDQN